MLSQLPVSTVFHSKSRCRANMATLYTPTCSTCSERFPGSLSPKPNECLHFDLESCNLMCTVVTDPCHIPLLAQARPMMLCIYTSYYIYIYIYLPYVRRSVNAGWALLTRNIAHADPCGRKIENNAVLFSRALSLQLQPTPTDRVKLPNQRGSKKTSDGAERDSCSDSRPEERKVEKLRVMDPARHATTTASERQATLQRKSTRKKGN